MSALEKATTLQQLHRAPEILRVVNVWDAITAKVVADLPETRAIATAGHSIAASHGYQDGAIPLEVAIAAIREITAATDLPVTADLEAGYGDPGVGPRPGQPQRVTRRHDRQHPTPRGPRAEERRVGREYHYSCTPRRWPGR